MEQAKLSFIIPAFNEEESLPRVLDSINKYVPNSLPHEVIVADNGSQDNTVNVAMNNGAKVLIDDKATVGGLRNRAAQKAKGRVLIFLDADIMLTEAWGEHINDVYLGLIDDVWQVTGSRCGISGDGGWIERFWFRPLVDKKVKYINSGHLITTPELFRHLGGFDERLESGEDYAFGKSAAVANAAITNNPLLAVIHEGYPNTLREFIKREIWHGRGECKSIRTIKTSNVAIAAILFMGLHILCVSGFFIELKYGIASVLLIVSICIFFALFKHGARAFKDLIVVSMLYYFYFISRFLSCIPPINAEKGR